MFDNKLTLIGKLSNDPEFKQVTQNLLTARVGLWYMRYMGKGQNGESKTQLEGFDIEFQNDRARELSVAGLRKGARVLVVCEQRSKDEQTQQGKKTYKHWVVTDWEIIADKPRFNNGQQVGQNQGQAMPQQGYQQPPQGYGPPQGYQQPAQGYAPPPAGYSQQAPAPGYAPQPQAPPPQGYAPQPPQPVPAPPQPGYAPPPPGYAPAPVQPAAPAQPATPPAPQGFNNGSSAPF